jgi:flagella basal body P-ring formation protein FlgA
MNFAMKSIRAMFVCAVLVAVPLQFAVAAIPASVVVKVHDLSMVAGTQFTLGDIALVTGTSVAQEARARAVVIGISPLPGLVRSLMPGDIIVHLRAAGFKPSSVRVIVPPMVEVQRKAITVSMVDASNVAVKAAQAAVATMPGTTITPDTPAGSVNVPVGKLLLEAGPVSGQADMGTLYVPVAIQVNGETVQTVQITLHVEQQATLVVANHTIAPQDIITASDVSLITVTVPHGFNSPVTTLDAVIGKRATSRISAGMPVPANALQTPPDITAGSVITILCTVGTVRITASGTAEAAGHVGQTIQVYANSTRKMLSGIILDRHTVQLTSSSNEVEGATGK